MFVSALGRVRTFVAAAKSALQSLMRTMAAKSYGTSFL